MARPRTGLGFGAVTLAAAALLASPDAARFASAEGTPPPAETAPPVPRVQDSPLKLFAAVEDAWLASDAERLADMVDTTVVRITLEPGTPPTSAITRNAALFLFRDQLRLVKTKAFRVTRLEIGQKSKPTATATAIWSADWGGRRGMRDLKVAFVAVPVGSRWVLTEVRAND
ncbi:MAG TPA: hypothetical protein VFR25_11255 [Candidatus Eisenbacteria bacterium]|nr:hypothetical protein [Candidatus Eisenbacteria bacterium]